jgi:hypothetical protein
MRASYLGEPFQTVAEYCRKTGLNMHALSTARRELKEKELLPDPGWMKQLTGEQTWCGPCERI